jgi:hypothetical protein
MNEKIKNNKNEVIKIFLTSSEKTLVKSYIENYNKINVENKKSISEFIREIIFKELLNIQNNVQNSSEEKEVDNREFNFKKMEKILNRNIIMIYKMLEKTFGEKEAENILNEIKNEEKS